MDGAEQKELDALFEDMFPGAPLAKPVLPPGYAVLARNPRLARAIFGSARYIEREMPWSQRLGVRELAVQAINHHFGCDFSFHAHLQFAQAHGVGVDKQAAIPYWRTTNLFSDEERMAVEYTFAVVKGDVSDELFGRVVERYGERGAVEFTMAIAWWSLWAMILNATRPEFAS